MCSLMQGNALFSLPPDRSGRNTLKGRGLAPVTDRCGSRLKASMDRKSQRVSCRYCSTWAMAVRGRPQGA